MISSKKRKPFKIYPYELLSYESKLDMLPNWTTGLTNKCEELHGAINMPRNICIKTSAALMAYPFSDKQMENFQKLKASKKQGFIMRHLITQAYRKKDLKIVIERYKQSKSILKEYKKTEYGETHRKMLLEYTILILDSLMINFTVRTQGLKDLIED